MADQQKKKRKPLPFEVARQMLTLATSGFGVVAALAWNSVIQELVNNYIKKLIPGNSGIVSLFLYAVIVSLLAILVTLELSKIMEKLDR